MKHYFYVVVESNNQAIFVTSTDNANKYAVWNRYEKPMKFSKSHAEDLAYCLNLNFYPTFVLESFYEIENQIFYKKED
jgi:hypothetical protein